MNTRTMYRVVVSFLILPVVVGCTTNPVVAKTEWAIYSILASLATAGVGAFIALRIRVLDESRATREGKLEDARVAWERELEQERAAREERRRALQAFDRYRMELLGFANDAIGVMGRVEGLLAGNPDDIVDSQARAMVRRDYLAACGRLTSEVSSLIDRGRFYFPNYENPGVGDQMGAAQQGLRDPVLNRLVAAGYVLKALKHHESSPMGQNWTMQTVLVDNSKVGEHLGNAIRHLSQAEQDRLGSQGRFDLSDLTVSARRAFVSDLFQIIQPRQWLKDVECAYGIKLRDREPEQMSPRSPPPIGEDTETD